MEIANRKLVKDIFGEWPSFHDAEVISIEVVRGEAPGEYANLRASIHVRKHEPRNVGTPAYELILTHSCIINFEFSGISELVIEGFNHQNVIDDLVFSPEGSAAKVEFVSIFGVGCAFYCIAASVVGVKNKIASA